MTKTILTLAAAISLSFGITSAHADTGLVAEKGVAWMAANGWTGEPVVVNGRSGTHWKCDGLVQADKSCKKTSTTTQVVRTAAQQTTVVSSSGRVLSESERLNAIEVVRQEERDRLARPASVVTVASTSAPVLTGGWAKKVVTPALIAEMLKNDVDDATWYALMNVSKKDFVKRMSWIAGLATPANVSDFSATIANATVQDCTARIALQLEAVSTNGQPRSFGKCLEGDTIWGLNGNWIWSQLQHEAVTSKNRILPKFEG